MKKYEIYITVFIFLWLFTFIVALYRINEDIKQIDKLEKQNKKFYQEIIDYRWQTDQYEYMFNKYCGGMNNG